MEDAYDYVLETPLVTETDYPYVGEETTCKVSDNNGSGNITRYVEVKPMLVAHIKRALVVGPIAIALESNNVPF